jgi:hypothetical protein
MEQKGPSGTAEALPRLRSRTRGNAARHRFNPPAIRFNAPPQFAFLMAERSSRLRLLPPLLTASVRHIAMCGLEFRDLPRAVPKLYVVTTGQ